MKLRGRIWFHRGRAVGWAILGVTTFIFGFQDSVVMVWIASVYANVVSDWTAGEALDHRDLIKRLDRIEKLVKENRCVHTARP